jgi:hypothetical protein
MVVTQKLQKDRDVTESWPPAVGLRHRHGTRCDSARPCPAWVAAGGHLVQINSVTDSPWQSGSMCHAV